MIVSPAPWSGEISDAPVRIAWVLFCLIAMPTLLRMCGIPSEMLSLFSVAAALPGCVAPLPVLGIKKAESKDFILIAGLYALIIILSAVIAYAFSELIDLILYLIHSSTPYSLTYIVSHFHYFYKKKARRKIFGLGHQLKVTISVSSTSARGISSMLFALTICLGGRSGL